MNCSYVVPTVRNVLQINNKTIDFSIKSKLFKTRTKDNFLG